MVLAADVARCQDALDNGCPDRKLCARWVARYPAWFGTPWEPFAARRKEKCEFIIKLEPLHDR